ncbi:LapA family protein [Natronococcus sp.]|uniref:LapA family protein n=1 Tax=Natronococcus sp. TaxID=35747 RepID=UPI0025F44080|nr:LapA family protein [Natronococcus sp.]
MTLQVPGGPELLSVLLLAVFFLGIPLLLIIGVYEYLDRKRGYERRIAALERRVDELEDE